MAGVVQNSTLSSRFAVSKFLFFCLSNLRYSRITGFATWTQATCQGLSTCLATSTPCESLEACFSEAMAKSLYTPLLFSYFFFCLSHCHFGKKSSAKFGDRGILKQISAMPSTCMLTFGLVGSCKQMFLILYHWARKSNSEKLWLLPLHPL